MYFSLEMGALQLMVSSSSVLDIEKNDFVQRAERFSPNLNLFY